MTDIPDELLEKAGRAGAALLELDWDTLDADDREEASAYHRLVLEVVGLPALLERVEAAEARTADLWDEGFNAGFDVGTTAAAGLPTPRHDNPYRGDLATGTPFNDGEFFDNRKANDV